MKLPFSSCRGTTGAKAGSVRPRLARMHLHHRWGCANTPNGLVATSRFSTNGPGINSNFRGHSFTALHLQPRVLGDDESYYFASLRPESIGLAGPRR